MINPRGFKDLLIEFNDFTNDSLLLLKSLLIFGALSNDRIDITLQSSKI